jgi:hypothetical protein
MKQGWIHCGLIIEVLGKPKEYITEVIGQVVESLGKMNGVELIKKEIHEPKPLQSAFTSFAEVEVTVRDLKVLSEIVFDYMPSNIEILAPAEIKMKLQDANLFMNFISGKLHAYDALAKRLKMENMVLKNKLISLGELPKEMREADEMSSLKSKKEEPKKEDKDKK